MLIEVKRHGFSFWEAPHRIGPAFDAPNPRKVRRLKMWERLLSGDPGPLRDMHGKRAKAITEDVNDSKLWGKLVELADSVELEVIESRIVGADFNSEGNQRLIADIQKRVRAAFGITFREFIYSDCVEAAWARMASMALCRSTVQGATLEEIGKSHGRNRSAALRALKRSEALRKTSGKFAAAIGRLEAGLLMQAA